MSHYVGSLLAAGFSAVPAVFLVCFGIHASLCISSHVPLIYLKNFYTSTSAFGLHSVKCYYFILGHDKCSLLGGVRLHLIG